MGIIITPNGHHLGIGRAHRFHSMLAKALPPLNIEVAASIDLSIWSPGVRDQKQEGACTGFATAEWRELVYGVMHQKVIPIRLAPAYPYARARMAMGTFPDDSGSTMADEFAILQADGIPPEADLPYEADPAEAPTPQSDADAIIYRTPNPTMVPADPQSMKRIFSLGRPIGIAMPVFQSFENVGPNGLVPMPGDAEQSLGGHGLLLHGYDSTGWLGTNSWSAQWGRGGRFTIPYGYETLFWELYTDVSTTGWRDLE